MARKPKKPQPPAETSKPFDELIDDGEAVDEDAVAAAAEAAAAAARARDWRDVEKYKEERALRRQIGDDVDLEDLDRPRATR